MSESNTPSGSNAPRPTAASADNGSTTGVTVTIGPPAIADARTGSWVARFPLLVAFWALSRVVMACIFMTDLCSYIRNDVLYYGTAVASSPVPLLDRMTNVLDEYPTPIVGFLQVINALAGGSTSTFVSVFVLVLCLADGFAVAALFFRESPRAGWVWAAAGLLLGPLLWFRLDLLPALAALGALHWMDRRPRLAGVMIALGAALKLWPALLIIPMMGRGRLARSRTLGFVVAGLVLGLGSLLTQGWARSASPLTYQGDRGLQIESVWATVPMVRRVISGDSGLTVFFSQYKAYEVSGPGVAGWIQVSDLLLVVMIVATVALGWLIGLRGVGLRGHRWAAPGEKDLGAIDWAIQLSLLAIICGVIVANKTLSPQYLMWLFPSLAIITARARGERQRRVVRRILAFAATSLALTPWVFPLGYSGLISSTPNAGVTWLLVLRNLGLVTLTAYSWFEAWRAAVRSGVFEPEL